MGVAIRKVSSLFSPSDDGTLVATSLKITLTLMIGLTAAVLLMYMANDSYRDTLTARVETIASALPAEEVLNAKQDLEFDNYGRSGNLLHEKLIAVKNTNDDLSFVYLMAMKDGDVVFLADGEQKDSSNYSEPGSTFDEASNELRNLFQNGGTVIEGPVSDRWGEWLSALTVIENPTNGQVIAVVGVDVESLVYYRSLAVAAFLPFFGAVLFSCIFWLADHRRKNRKDALRFKSELVSIASHELRTPLTGIRWGQETLLKDTKDEKHAEILNSMYDSTLRLQESIEDILQLANWQAGRNQELRLAPLDMHALFAGIFATQKLPAAQRGIKLEFSHDWPEEVIVKCDMQRVKRVMNNLVSNAIKYARPNTAVTVGYENVDGQHLFSIQDQGIGIPQMEQEKVFGGFYRATNAVKHEAGGTGMGLYMSRTTIEQHGGKLWLQSIEDKGTTAYVQLP